MSTSTPKKTDNEEIDLGALFNAIGSGISNLFNAIGSAIQFVLNTLLSFIIFIRKRIIYFALACTIGFIAGAIAERTSTPEYIATATLEPHFDSARQLYSSINYLNVLAKQKDTTQLSLFFDIPAREAATITSLEIEPFTNETRLLKEYSTYLSSLDSLAALETSFDKYVNGLENFERKVHILKIKSIKQDVFRQLLDPIVNSVSEIYYFRNQQKTALSNLEQSDSITRVSIVQTDSLLKLFEKIKVIEANKEYSNGTNLFMSQSTKDNDEILLLDRKISLSEKLDEIRVAKLKSEKVVDIIATFPNVGYQDTSLLKNKKVQGILAGFIVLSLFYFVLHADAFILSQKKD